MKSILIYFFVFFVINTTYSKSVKEDSIWLQKTCLDIHNKWLKTSIDLTKNTVGYTAPVASRTFSYISIGMYESTISILPELNSLSNQIANYKRPEIQNKLTKISALHLSNYVDYELIKYFFENMPPSFKEITNLKYNENYKLYKKKISKKEKIKAEEYGDLLLTEIKKVAEKNGGKKAWNNNYPKEYKSPVCEGCWVKTFPGYISALQPYWGNHTLLIENNNDTYSNIPYLPFTKDSTTSFFNESKMIYEL